MPQLKHNHKGFVQEIKQRNINSLVHFTPTRNLMGMFELGKIINRSELERIGQDHIDYLLDYTQMTDEYRYDDPSYINLSIEHPNSFLLNRFKQKTISDFSIQWCVLKINTEPICWHSTAFAVHNASSNFAKNIGIGTELKHFKNLFKDSLSIPGSYGSKHQLDRQNLANCHPTSIQAEVLVKDPIYLSHIKKVVFENEDDKLRARAAVSGLTDLELTIDKQLFRKTRN